jgi:hypothetical protein
MPLTLLQIINTAQNELGLPASATIVGNTDPTTVQMFALTNRILDELRRLHPTGWSAMMSEFNIVVNTPILTTANITNNSPVVTNILAGTGSLAAQFWAVSGNSIPQAARIKSVDSATQITMTMEATGTVTAGAITFAQDTYAYPTDYDFTQNRTQWDRSNRWELLGPDSPQMDQWHRSGIVATGPRRHWRKIGDLANQFRIWPQPVEIANPLQLAFEYLSVNGVALNGNSATTARYFANDTDQPFLDDQALIMGLKWRFFQIKGFNFADLKNDWLDYVNSLIGRDEGAATLNMVKRVNPIFISPANVQDGFFPGPVGPNAS